MLIQTFPTNTAGNDYLCADIHGHFELLEQKLNQVNFDPAADRLFSLGDLIDRGPDSPRAFTWLDYPWFHAIQGNHERMLINSVEQDSPQLWYQWMHWGGDWATEYDRESIQPFYEKLRGLPVAIELALRGQHSVGLIHAELPDICDWLNVRDELSSQSHANIERELAISDMLWLKRQPFMDRDEMDGIQAVSNIHHVFHGHTIVPAILTLANRTFLDLGSYQTGEIGFIQIQPFLNSLASGSR